MCLWKISVETISDDGWERPRGSPTTVVADTVLLTTLDDVDGIVVAGVVELARSPIRSRRGGDIVDLGLCVSETAIRAVVGNESRREMWVVDNCDEIGNGNGCECGIGGIVSLSHATVSCALNSGRIDSNECDKPKR